MKLGPDSTAANGQAPQAFIGKSQKEMILWAQRLGVRENTGWQT